MVPSGITLLVHVHVILVYKQVLVSTAWHGTFNVKNVNWRHKRDTRTTCTVINLHSIFWNNETTKSTLSCTQYLFTHWCAYIYKFHSYSLTVLLDRQMRNESSYRFVHAMSTVVSRFLWYKDRFITHFRRHSKRSHHHPLDDGSINCIYIFFRCCP